MEYKFLQVGLYVAKPVYTLSCLFKNRVRIRTISFLGSFVADSLSGGFIHESEPNLSVFRTLKAALSPVTLSDKLD